MQLTDREQAIVTALSTKIDSLQQALVKYQTDVLLPLTKQASDQITAAAQERNKLIEQAIQEEKKVAGLVKDLPDKVERGVKQATKNHVDDMLARERQVEGKAAEFRAEGARHADKTNAAIILQRLCRKARMEIMPGKQWEGSPFLLELMSLAFQLFNGARRKLAVPTTARKPGKSRGRRSASPAPSPSRSTYCMWGRTT